MKYLLYCITAERQPGVDGPELLGVDGQPIFFIADNGLKAAVSNVDENMAPDISQLMAYEKVVAALHQQHGVIPLRYGSLLEDEAHIIQHLGEQRKRYNELLYALAGCVEMGIRLLPPQTKACPPTMHKAPPLSSGYAYLEARRKHYAPDMPPLKAVEEIFQQCRQLFEGLFVSCKMETPLEQITTNAYRVSLPSFYFLVPKKLVDAFCMAFRNTLPPEKAAKLLLNGPWPPYNFCTAVAT